jgi:hypothetical protein
MPFVSSQLLMDLEPQALTKGKFNLIKILYLNEFILQ